MEYKDIFKEIVDSLNYYNREYKGVFIPNITIQTAEGPYKCFKNIMFCLYHKYLKDNNKVFDVTLTAKEVNGSIDADLVVIKNLVCSKIFELVSNKEEMHKYGIK